MSEFVKLCLAFNGHDFTGWQWQKIPTKEKRSPLKNPKHSVEECLYNTIVESNCKLEGMVETVRLPKNVNAKELFVLLKNPDNLSVENLQLRLSDSSPPSLSISVESCSSVEYENPSYLETYTCSLYQSAVFDSTISLTSQYVKTPLDMVVVKEAIKAVKGLTCIFETTHITELEVALIDSNESQSISRQGYEKVNAYSIKVCGYGTLKTDVRTLFALMIDVGQGICSLATFIDRLDKRRPGLAGVKPSSITLSSMQFFNGAKDFTRKRKRNKKVGTATVREELVSSSGARPPEGHILGNFNNYYEFNTVSERLSKIPEEVWRTFKAMRVSSLLDIGCNDGSLTVALHEELQKCGQIDSLGIDIDANLIEKGKKEIQHMGSNCRLQCCDIMNGSDFLNTFNKIQKFDLVTCFGVTMWIHLNHGDKEFVRFLETVASLTKKALILEPQIWKNYKSAKGRIRKAGASVPTMFTSLELTGERVMGTIDSVLMSQASDKFTSKKVLGETKWKRQVILYLKK